MTILKLRIIKRVLIKKAQIEYNGSELERVLKEIEEVFNCQIKENKKAKRLR